MVPVSLVAQMGLTGTAAAAAENPLAQRIAGHEELVFVGLWVRWLSTGAPLGRWYPDRVLWNGDSGIGPKVTGFRHLTWCGTRSGRSSRSVPVRGHVQHPHEAGLPANYSFRRTSGSPDAAARAVMPDDLACFNGASVSQVRILGRAPQGWERV